MNSCHAGCGGRRKVCGSIQGSCKISIVKSSLASILSVTVLLLKQFSWATRRAASFGYLNIISVSMCAGAAIVGDLGGLIGWKE